MIAVTLTSIIVFLGITFFGHWSHYMLHQPWSGKLYKAHMTHHFKLYPPEDYVSDVYRDPGKDNTVYIFLALSSPLFLIPIGLYLLGWISLGIFILAIIEMLFIGYLHDRIHDAFHIRKNIWRYLPWFRKWDELHYTHHINVQSNFGIFTFHWDKLFGTYLGEKKGIFPRWR